MASKSLGRTCACGKTLYNKNTTGRCLFCENAHRRGAFVVPEPPTVEADRERRRTREQIKHAQDRYHEALKRIEDLERQVGIVGALRTVNPLPITPKLGRHQSEATPILVASDWHVEETVGPEVGGLNQYSLEIARDRALRFWKSGHRLIQLLNQDVNISQVVVALLGDFITNELHDAESAEHNEVQPIHALLFAQDLIISGINFLLDNTSYRFTFVCHSGNHARTSKRTRFSAENGHSLEYLMYRHLQATYADNPRVEFVVSPGYHTYLPVYDELIRFHHGHAIRYAGGVGGIYIPVHKAVANWNRAKTATLDVFGHFHQRVDGGNFLCNGSLIGYNGFAVSIKAPFEKPTQTLFLMDKKRGRTCTWPVMVTPVE